MTGMQGAARTVMEDTTEEGLTWTIPLHVIMWTAITLALLMTGAVLVLR